MKKKEVPKEKKSRFEQLYDLMGKPYYVVMWENPWLRDDLIYGLVFFPLYVAFIIGVIFHIRLNLVVVYVLIDVLQMKYWKKEIRRKKEEIIRNEEIRLHPEILREELKRLNVEYKEAMSQKAELEAKKAQIRMQKKERRREWLQKLMFWR